MRYFAVMHSSIPTDTCYFAIEVSNKNHYKDGEYMSGGNLQFIDVVSIRNENELQILGNILKKVNNGKTK